jgi:hypothetical protein
MAEKMNSKRTNDNSQVDPEGLRAKYDSLAAYGRTVVTFRFTVLGFYLTAVGLVLAGMPTFWKYLLLTVIAISLWTIELRNRTLKNELSELTRQIEKIWGYTQDKKDDYHPYPTKVFGITIPTKATENLLTHSNALDLLYFSVFLYALINMIILSIPLIKSLILSIIVK